MRNCIICRKQKNDKLFNREHLFPEAVGGAYVTKSVCKACNSKLGVFVDSPFCKQSLVAYFRNHYQLSKDNRGIHNPFKEFNKSNTADFVLSFQDGQFQRRQKNKKTKKITIDESGKENIKITYTFDKNYQLDKGKLINRVAKELKVPVERIEHTLEEKITPDTQITVSSPQILIVQEIIKIAYEYTAIHVENYLEDEMGLKYAKMLSDCNFDIAFLQSCNLDISKVEINIDKSLSEIIHHSHVIIIYYLENIGLVTITKLFNGQHPFCYVFLMSKNDSYKNVATKMLVNDFKGKKAIEV